MANRHIGGNPLGASRSALAVLGGKSRRKAKSSRSHSTAVATPETESISASAARGMASASAERKPTRRNGERRKTGGKTGEGADTGAAGGKANVSKSSKTGRGTSRRSFSTTLPDKKKKQSTRRKKGHHLAGAPEAMDEQLREEFRGALRSSLTTDVAPLDERRVASLELRLSAMESTGGPLRDEIRRQLGDLSSKLEVLETRIKGSPWLVSDVPEPIVELESRVENLEASSEEMISVSKIESLRKRIRKVESAISTDSDAEVLGELRERLDQLESGRDELARKDSLAEIWERLQSLEITTRDLAHLEDLVSLEHRIEDDRSGEVSGAVMIEARLGALEARELDTLRREELAVLLARMEEISALESRVERVEAGRRDNLRREALSTLEARFYELETSVEARLECLEAGERNLARQASVNSLAARAEVMEARMARLEVAGKSHATADELVSLAARVEELALDTSGDSSQELIAHLASRIEYLEEGSEDERAILEGRIAVLEAAHDATRDRDEELTLLCEELKLQASELEEARQFAHAARRRLADLEERIGRIRADGATVIIENEGANAHLVEEVGHLREEVARRDSASALLWCVAIGALAFSAFQIVLTALA